MEVRYPLNQTEADAPWQDGWIISGSLMGDSTIEKVSFKEREFCCIIDAHNGIQVWDAPVYATKMYALLAKLEDVGRRYNGVINLMREELDSHIDKEEE